MTDRAECEEKMVFMVRNALLVAQREMGDGDQWPVIKDTIHKIMRLWEDLKAERNVVAELKTHLYEQLKVMDAGLVQCAPKVRAELEPKVKEWREVCDAYFSDIDCNAVVHDIEIAPLYIKRMNAILSTLEEGHD